MGTTNHSSRRCSPIPHHDLAAGPKTERTAPISSHDKPASSANSQRSADRRQFRPLPEQNHEGSDRASAPRRSVHTRRPDSHSAASRGKLVHSACLQIRGFEFLSTKQPERSSFAGTNSLRMRSSVLQNVRFRLTRWKPGQTHVGVFIQNPIGSSGGGSVYHLITSQVIAGCE
jgi:hypothetical protein